MKTLKLISIIVISIIPFLNSVVATSYAIFSKRYRAAVYAALFLITTFVLFEMDRYSTNQHILKKYDVENRSDLRIFYFEDISFSYPEYSLIKTTLPNGYHEEIKKENGKEYVHKISVLDGKYESYLIEDKEGNIIGNKLKKLYNQQLENYKKDHPNKKVVFSDEIYSTYYSSVAVIFVLLSMIHCFFTLRKDKEETVDQSSQMRIRPSREIQKVVENEKNLNTSIEHLLEDEKDLEIVSTTTTTTTTKTVDVNKADQSAFSQLEGVSSIQALYFIKEREDHGNYTSISNFFERNSISKHLKNKLNPLLSITEQSSSEEKKDRRGRILDF